RYVDVRVLAASNRNLHQAVIEKQFREDLYYRLNVVTLTIAPLRDRREDIPPLAERFARLAAAADGLAFGGFDPGVMDFLRECSWPGNARELENAIRRAVILSNGRRISVGDLPTTLRRGP